MTAATLSEPLTYVFTGAVLASLLVKFWLFTRQMRYVAMHRDAVPDAFAATITLHAHQRAADYTLVKGRFGLIGMAFGAVVLFGWTLFGGLEALNVAVSNAVRPRFGGLVYQLGLLACFATINGLLDLPFNLYSTFRIEQRFGFNRVTWTMYVADTLKATAIGMLIGLPIAALTLWIMEAAGGLWWLWASGVWMAFNLLILVLYPSVIAPLFNTFKPLADETLNARVHALMARCGFAVKGLFVMDGSKRSAHANAYFTGFGASKRVVFFDTLLAKLSPGEVEAVLAHELGHFKHKHVIKRIALMFAISVVGFAMLGWLTTQVWYYTGLGVHPSLVGPNDAVALLIFLLVAPAFSFFVSPLFARLSRRHEFEADAYACQQTSGVDLAAALLKLHEDNAATLTPDPMYVQFYYSHPPASERLAALMHTHASVQPI